MSGEEKLPKFPIRSIYGFYVRRWREEMVEKLQKRFDKAKDDCKTALQETYNPHCLALKFMEIIEELLDSLKP